MYIVLVQTWFCRGLGQKKTQFSEQCWKPKKKGKYLWCIELKDYVFFINYVKFMFVIFPFFPIFFVWEGEGSWPLFLISIDKGRIKTKFKIFAKVRVNYSMLFKIFVISYNVDIFPSQQVFFPLPISSVTKTYIYILFVKKFQYFCPIYPLKSRRLKIFFFLHASPYLGWFVRPADPGEEGEDRGGGRPHLGGHRGPLHLLHREPHPGIRSKHRIPKSGL